MLSRIQEQVQVNANVLLAPSLELLFEQFAQAGIRYVVLRGADELLAGKTDGDIDLLIDPRSYQAANNLLKQLGFLRLERWGYAPHTFYVQYDQQVGWIKLDIVTALAYDKPIAVIETDLVQQTLAHRCAYGPIFTPAAEEAFISLWLHCLLDVGDVEAKYQQQLRQLALQIQDEKRIQVYIDRYSAAEYPWPILRQLLDRNDWSLIPRIAERTKRKLTRSKMLSTQLQRIRGRAQRKFNKIARTWGRQGLIVAFLAPDGAGKTTVIKALHQQRLLDSKQLYMGTNPQHAEFPLTRMLARWRKAAWAKPLWSVSTQLEQLWRYRRALRYRQQGKIVLCDRYPSAALRAHASNKPWQQAIGKPDLLIYLDAPAEVLQPRKQQHTREQLELQRQVFECLLAEAGNYIRVDASQDPHEVQHKVLNIIWQHYQQGQAK